MSLCPPDLDWTAVPFAGQDCSVPDSVLVVENLCQVSGQKGFRAPDRTVSSRTVPTYFWESLSGKRTKGIPCSWQDCSFPDSVLVVENLSQVSGQKCFSSPDRTVPSRTVSSEWRTSVRLSCKLTLRGYQPRNRPDLSKSILEIKDISQRNRFCACQRQRGLLSPGHSCSSGGLFCERTIPHSYLLYFCVCSDLSATKSFRICLLLVISTQSCLLCLYRQCYPILAIPATANFLSLLLQCQIILSFAQYCCHCTSLFYFLLFLFIPDFPVLFCFSCPIVFLL